MILLREISCQGCANLQRSGVVPVTQLAKWKVTFQLVAFRALIWAALARVRLDQNLAGPGARQCDAGHRLRISARRPNIWTDVVTIAISRGCANG